MRPQQLRLLGAGSNGTQGAVSNVYGGLTSTGGSVDLSATLQSYCVQGSDCSAAIQTATSAYQSLGASAQSAVVDLANGNGVAAASAIAPLIGGALGATVGGPLGAAIGATVAGSVESIFSGLFGQQSPPQPDVVHIRPVERKQRRRTLLPEPRLRAWVQPIPQPATRTLAGSPSKTS